MICVDQTFFEGDEKFYLENVSQDFVFLFQKFIRFFPSEFHSRWSMSSMYMNFNARNMRICLFAFLCYAKTTPKNLEFWRQSEKNLHLFTYKTNEGVFKAEIFTENSSDPNFYR